MTQQHPKIAVVAEAFLDWPLRELVDWLVEAAPEVTALELGSGGYAPHPHCDRRQLLADADARRRWSAEIRARDLDIAALNVWGNPLHPDAALGDSHDQALRETIRLAAELGVNRVVALAGCPAARPGDITPYFAAGGWLPYLEGIYEQQWEQYVAPYWQALSEFARSEHPEVLICIELHPGTVVYNVDSFLALAALGDNIAANIDPSHFFWQQMDACAVLGRLGSRVGHIHAKDVLFNQDVLAVAGLLDRRWPGPSADVAWKFATVGQGHDHEWWRDFVTQAAESSVIAIAIEHEDPDVRADIGVPQSARLLNSTLEVAA